MFCFPDCWKFLSVIPVFKNVGKRFTTKNYCPHSLPSVVSKVFEKLLNNRIVDHSSWAFFLISSMVLGLLDQLQVFSVFLSDRIAGAFNRSGAPWAVALDISQAFDKVWHAGLLHKPKSYGISGQIFDLISSFISNRQLQVVLNGKS